MMNLFFCGGIIGTQKVPCCRFMIEGFYDSGISLNKKVATVTEHSSWKWPSARSDNLVAIQASICDQVFVPSQNDKVIWTLTVNGIMSEMERINRVDWFKLLWSSLCLIRYSFISWLAILNRLSTRDGQMG